MTGQQIDQDSKKTPPPGSTRGLRRNLTKEFTAMTEPTINPGDDPGMGDRRCPHCDGEGERGCRYCSCNGCPDCRYLGVLLCPECGGKGWL